MRLSMNTTDQHIRSAVEQFVRELETLIRQAAVAAVSDALGVSGTLSHGPTPAKPGAARTRNRKGSKPGTAAQAKRTTSPAPMRPLSASRSKGKRVRRSMDQIDALSRVIREFVAKNPGQGSEEIKKALKISKKDWGLPIAKLVVERKLTTKGKKRATRYFVPS